jgi:hypothetical protein
VIGPIYRERVLKEKPALIIILITLAALVLVTCVQQEQPSKGSPAKKAAAKKPPVKLQYLTGEILSVNKARKTILVRRKDDELSFHIDRRTSIKIDGQSRSLADVTVGKRAAIRYVEAEDKNIVRSLVISTPPPETKASPEAPARNDVPAGKAAVQP